MSLDDDLARWEAGYLSREELIASYASNEKNLAEPFEKNLSATSRRTSTPDVAPELALVKMLDLHERLVDIGSEPVPYHESDWEQLRDSLPDRLPTRRVFGTGASRGRSSPRPWWSACRPAPRPRPPPCASTWSPSGMGSSTTSVWSTIRSRSRSVLRSPSSPGMRPDGTTGPGNSGGSPGHDRRSPRQRWRQPRQRWRHPWRQPRQRWRQPGLQWRKHRRRPRQLRRHDRVAATPGVPATPTARPVAATPAVPATPMARPAVATRREPRQRWRQCRGENSGEIPATPAATAAATPAMTPARIPATVAGTPARTPARTRRELRRGPRQRRRQPRPGSTVAVARPSSPTAPPGRERASIAEHVARAPVVVSRHARPLDQPDRGRDRSGRWRSHSSSFSVADHRRANWRR